MRLAVANVKGDNECRPFHYRLRMIMPIDVAVKRSSRRRKTTFANSVLSPNIAYLFPQLFKPRLMQVKIFQYPFRFFFLLPAQNCNRLLPPACVLTSPYNLLPAL
jgi:hypothetical protein